MTLRLVRSDSPREEPSSPRFVPVPELAVRDLAWQKVRGQDAYELRGARALVAAFYPESRGALRSRAEAATGTVSFHASGNTWKRVDLHDAAGRPLGVFRERWTGGGTLILAAGPTFKLSPANLWRSEWTWRDEGGQALLHWQHWEQTLAPAGIHAPETIVLMTLSWYLNVLAAHAGRAGASLSFLHEPEE